MKLRVSSIDPSVDKIQLQELFEEYGEVVSVKIFRSLEGMVPALGFVEMKREKEAERALKAISGKLFGETSLKVEFSTDRVTSHNKVPSLPILDDEYEEDDDGYEEEEEDDDKIKEIPLHELDEEI